MSIQAQTSTAYDAMNRAAAFVRRPQPGVLALAGDDAAEFLQGQLTNDIEALQPGDGCYAALLTPKGKIRADMLVTCTADALLIVTAAPLVPLLQHTIDTFRIGYFFTSEDRTQGTALVGVIGPSARETVAQAIGDAPRDAEGANAVTDTPDGPLIAIRTQLGVNVLGPRAAVDALVERLTAAGVPEADTAAAEILRVERAVPAFGMEFDENTIPGEAGLNARAVSFEKGCYVGQETVARMHYKGHPNRVLRTLQADLPLTPGAPVAAADGRELGKVGTAVVSPVYGPLALAILRREADAGDTVDAGGVPARVKDAPIGGNN